MGKYEYNKEKHKRPMYELSLNDFYYIIHNKKILIFKKEAQNV